MSLAGRITIMIKSLIASKLIYYMATIASPNNKYWDEINIFFWFVDAIKKIK